MLYTTLYVFIGIFLIAGIISLIYYFIKNKNKKIDKNKIGYINSKTIKKIQLYSEINGWKTLVNLLVKNNYSKLQKSLIPILIFSDNKIFVVTNMLDNYKEILITNNNFESAYKIKKNSKKLIENFYMIWYKDILKWVSKFTNNVEFIILKNTKTVINNKSNYKVFSLTELKNYIDNFKNIKNDNFDQDKLLKQIQNYNELIKSTKR